MNIEKLDRANFIQKKIHSIDDFIKFLPNIYRMEIKIINSDSRVEQKYIVVENKYEQEVIDMLKRWLDEYKKEFEEL